MGGVYSMRRAGLDSEYAFDFTEGAGLDYQAGLGGGQLERDAFADYQGNFHSQTSIASQGLDVI